SDEDCATGVNEYPTSALNGGRPSVWTWIKDIKSIELTIFWLSNRRCRSGSGRAHDWTCGASGRTTGVCRGDCAADELYVPRDRGFGCQGVPDAKDVKTAVVFARCRSGDRHRPHGKSGDADLRQERCGHRCAGTEVSAAADCTDQPHDRADYVLAP